MPKTAKQHFTEDVTRAANLYSHAAQLNPATNAERILRDDILRGAWMFTIGALDAYFCDAYADLLARTLRAKSIQPSARLEDHIRNVKVPVASILAPYKQDNWRWRMAARHMMELQNVLQLTRVRELFNHFCREEHKLYSNEHVHTWLNSAKCNHRIFGTTQTKYTALTGKAQTVALKAGREYFFEHYGAIIQRRHDCIHNCDRPKVSVQPIRAGTVKNVMRDIGFLIDETDDWLDKEFREYLKGIRCNALTRNQVLVGF